MANSNSNSEERKYCRCPHGRCLNHGPEWENIGKSRLEPNPRIFGIKTYWITARCCGKPMTRYKVVQKKRCRKCGRTEDQVEDKDLALCLCCGYHFTNDGISG